MASSTCSGTPSRPRTYTISGDATGRARPPACAPLSRPRAASADPSPHRQARVASGPPFDEQGSVPVEQLPLSDDLRGMGGAGEGKPCFQRLTLSRRADRVHPRPRAALVAQPSDPSPGRPHRTSIGFKCAHAADTRSSRACRPRSPKQPHVLSVRADQYRAARAVAGGSTALSRLYRQLRGPYRADHPTNPTR